MIRTWVQDGRFLLYSAHSETMKAALAVCCNYYCWCAFGMGMGTEHGRCLTVLLQRRWTLKLATSSSTGGSSGPGNALMRNLRIWNAYNGIFFRFVNIGVLSGARLRGKDKW